MAHRQADPAPTPLVLRALADRICGEKLGNDERFDNVDVRRANKGKMWRLLEYFASDYTKREVMAITSSCARCVLSSITPVRRVVRLGLLDQAVRFVRRKRTLSAAR